MENLKRIIKVISIILIIILLCLIFAIIDYSRTLTNLKPIFSITNPSKEYSDSDVVEYLGLGYKIIDFNVLDGNDDDVKIGTWFMKYEDFEDKDETDDYTIISAVVVKADENRLSVMEKNNSNNLYYVSIPKGDTKTYTRGQEIAIYCNGTILETFPASFSNVEKVEIIKQTSQVQIPNKVLAYFYSTTQNVSVSINELTSTGLSFSVTDKNEFPYEAGNSYVINKKVKNENYTGRGEFVGENTEHSTQGYTGTGLEYLMQEVSKISEIPYESTIQDLTYNLPSMTDESNYIVWGKKLDWTSLYGTLTSRRV